jgi:hypothetical protein
MPFARIPRMLLRVTVTALVAGAVLGILPPPAGASPPVTVVRAVALDEARLVPSTAAAAGTPAGGIRIASPAWSPRTVVCAPIRFTMVGLVWHQDGHSAVPARVSWGRPGVMGPAVTVAADPAEGPDPGSPDDSGLVGTTPVWTGEARCARFRLRIPAREALEGVRAVFVNASGTADPRSFLDRAGDALARAWGMATDAFAPDAAEAAADQPPIITRKQWGAAERIRRCGPDYAEDGVKMAYVHHTVSSNGYARSRADDLIRGIYAYHVKGRGFCDIAYNFLIDRFGRIYEGRYGGVDQPVVGAHAMGFNTGSTGVAALGTYTTAKPPRAMIRAYKRLLAWRLDVAHVRPTGKAAMISAGGSAQKFDKGQTVMLPAISGHRHTGFTICPGTRLFKRLSPIRGAAETIGLPKLWAPRATPEAISLWQAQTMRFQATLSREMAWTIDVAWNDPVTLTTQTVRRFSGTGTAIDVTWDGKRGDGVSLVPTGSYAVTFAAQGDGAVARPATIAVTVNP